MTDQRRPDETGPTVFLASGREDDDPAALWTALLAVAHEDGDAEPPPDGPQAWAKHGLDASVQRMRSLLDAGCDRTLVVPVGVVDVADDTDDDDPARTAWQLLRSP